MYDDEKDFGGADILDPKKKRLGGEEDDFENFDDADPDFIGFDEEDDLFMNAGFGDEQEDY